jgi:hypothetical protein
MILSAIINLLLPIVDFVIGFLPSADPGVTNFINSTTAYFRNILLVGNTYFDMNSLLLVLSFILTIEIIIMTYKLTKWIVAVITAGFFKNA